MKKFGLLWMFLGLLIFWSCSGDDDSCDGFVEVGNSYLVLSQGNFSDGVGTVTAIRSNFSTFDQNAFEGNNCFPVGSVLQSGFINGNSIYLIANGSSIIQVVDRDTFTVKATIEGNGLNSPRYMTVASGKGYVTNWGGSFLGDDNFISVIDLTSNNTIGTISVPATGVVERIYTVGNYVYALNEGFGSGSTITVIDPSLDTIETTLSVGISPETAFVKGSDLYVLSEGGETDDAEIWKVSGLNATKVFDFDDIANGQTASFLNGIGNTLYFIVNESGTSKIYSLPIDGDLTSDLTEIIDVSGVGQLNDFTISNGNLVVLDAVQFGATPPGIAKFYDPSGALLSTFSTGIFPGSVLFNN